MLAVSRALLLRNDSNSSSHILALDELKQRDVQQPYMHAV
jgi:hypothetical protein